MSHHNEFALPISAIDLVKKYDDGHKQGLSYSMGTQI